MKRTELRRKTELKAKKPMARGNGPKRTGTPAKTRKGGGSNTGLDALKRQARTRDDDTCVKCGLVVIGRESNVHHRRNRGMGGSRAANTISNLITLCGTPTSGCHGDVTLRPWEFDAEHYGWVLPTNGTQDPADVPVLVAWLGWCLPTTDGDWTLTEAPS